LEEWNASFVEYRAKVVEAYRSVYVPLRGEVVSTIEAARADITSMTEFDQLNTANRASVRAELLADGQPLAEMSMPDLHGDDQLVMASRTVGIPFLRSLLAALPGQLTLAKTRVLELYAAEQEDKDRPKIAVWNPESAFSGTQFTTEDEVDMVFDSAKEEVKTLIRDGKVVRIL